MPPVRESAFGAASQAEGRVSESNSVLLEHVRHPTNRPSLLRVRSIDYCCKPQSQTVGEAQEQGTHSGASSGTQTHQSGSWVGPGGFRAALSCALMPAIGLHPTGREPCALILGGLMQAILSGQHGYIWVIIRRGRRFLISPRYYESQCPRRSLWSPCPYFNDIGLVPNRFRTPAQTRGRCETGVRTLSE